MNAIGYGNSMFLSTHGILARPTASFTDLLDTYSGATAAYSVRRLSSTYTGNAIRVRRSSDNAEQNIGFVNNELDTASLLTFCGVGNGFVTTWYDQSGNANDAIMSTAANQPQIVSSGSLLTVNSKPCLSFDGTNDYFNLTSNISTGSSSFNTFVGKRGATGRRLFGLAGISTFQYLWGIWSDNFAYLQAKTTGYNFSVSNLDTTQILLTGLNNAGTMSMFKNGNTLSSTFTSTSLNVNINALGLYSTFYAYCELQEIVFYNSEQSANRTGIETNINSFFTIY